MTDLLNIASSTFEAYTGLNYASTTGFLEDQIQLVWGVALATVSELMPWIIAIFVTSSIVFFAFRAFRFFRH